MTNLRTAFLAISDAFLASKIARPLWLLAYLREIRSGVRALRESRREIPLRFGFEIVDWGNKIRILISRPFLVPITEVQETYWRFDRDDADQLLVDAILLGDKELEGFLLRMESDDRKPYWDHAYSKKRVEAVRRLLEAEPTDFTLVVFPLKNSTWEIIDGHHRFRICQQAKLEEVKIQVGIIAETINRQHPTNSFLSKVKINRK